MKNEWRDPWHPTDSLALAAELRREMAPGHVLANEAKLVPIARRQDQDDVLFGLGDGRVAVVHLTYSTMRETSDRYPSATIYPDLEHFMLVVMPRDANEFGG